MSSLKHIMDVDVEPLDLYRRKGAPQDCSPLSTTLPKQTSRNSPSLEEYDNDSNENKSPKRRNSTRSSRFDITYSLLPSTARQSSEEKIDLLAHEAESMDYLSGLHHMSVPAQASAPSPQTSSTGSEYGMDRPVKYTPVTGRISRAKKGVPVHTCDICRPVKTFTRAEHLRRHQLSHQKPAYPCNFEDCERAFHRPDLLARHVQKHDNPGEVCPNSGDPRSRTSSVASDGRNKSVQMETLSQQHTGNVTETQGSPRKSVTPKATENHAIPSSYGQISPNFTTNRFPSAVNSNKRSRSVALPETYDPLPPRNAPPRPSSGNYNLANPSNFADQSQPVFAECYATGPNSAYQSYPATPQLHLLQIPEEHPVVPALSYPHESSPWCSSASSTASTQSEGSRGAAYWSRGDRTGSTVAMSNWQVPIVGIPQWSHTIMATPQDGQNSGYESILDHYDGSYTPLTQSMPPAGVLLNASSSVGFYPMEAAVDIPATSAFKNFALHPSIPRYADIVLGNDQRKKCLVASPHLGELSINTITAHASQTQDLEIYIDSYFEYFHVFFPVIHRPTFDRNNDTLLTFAMAAIGTQYHSSIKARTRGAELNKSAKEGIDLRPNWSTSTMQAIILTEMFTRFRGLRIDVQLSHQYEELYSRLLNSPMPHILPDISLGSDVQARWVHWINVEARQRLLALCFMFDIHQSIYHEQARSKARRDLSDNQISLPCSESLWSANSAIEWEADGSDYSCQLLQAVERNITVQEVLNRSPFSQTLLVCSFATRLPKRIDFTHPNDFTSNAPNTNIQDFTALFPSSPLAHIYMALHYTPLHDLLAVSGDTWVFRTKIKPPSSFHAAQFRLKNWSSSLAAAQATYHACRFLSSALSSGYGRAPFPSTFEELKNGTICIWDYWSLYVATLICWAFGNRYQSVSVIASYSNTSLAINSGEVDDSSTASTPTDEARPKALHYVDNMLALGVEDMLTRKANFKGDTASLIDAVRRRLELENIGNKSSLLVDAIGVLNKIRVGGKFWF